MLLSTPPVSWDIFEIATLPFVAIDPIPDDYGSGIPDMGLSDAAALFLEELFFLSLALRILVSYFCIWRIWLKSLILSISILHSFHFNYFLFFFDLKNSAVTSC